MNSENVKSILTVEIRSEADTSLLSLLKSLLKERARADGGDRT